MTGMKIMIDSKCEDIGESFKGEVGKFFKNCIVNEQDVALLRDLESKMS